MSTTKLRCPRENPLAERRVKCWSPNLEPTGRRRVSRKSRTPYLEMRCLHCGHTFWRREDRHEKA